MEFQQQYQFIQSSRKVLLEYCQTLSEAGFLAENSSFGRGSIRNLLVHIGNTYEFWLGRHALKQEIPFTEYSSITKASEVHAYFHRIDSLVAQFVKVYSTNYLTEIELCLNGKTIHASPLQLFTHVITHEFHHKGQILSLSRHLGYVPVDTDIIR